MKQLVYHFTKIGFCLSVVLFFFNACSTKTVPFATSTVVPGAEGVIKVKKDNNQNYLINLDIDNLAPPKSLTPPRNSYVAWMETKENGVKNIGQVNSEKATFSKARKAQLSTVSTFKPTRIFITAEDTGNLEVPGTMVVMTTDAFEGK